MDRCDLCYDKDKRIAARVPGEQFVQAVRQGFDPFNTPGIDMPKTMIAYGFGDESTYIGWKNIELGRQRPRLLCTGCYSAFSNFQNRQEPGSAPGQELPDTQPNSAVAETRPNVVKNGLTPLQSKPAGRKKSPAWLAVLVLILLIVIGILGGYGSGMGQRLSAQRTLVTGQLQEQYQLGLEAAKAGQYNVAKQHFEFILQQNPNFPGVQAAYTDLLVRMLITPSPTITLTPTVSPTPDTRSVDEIYANVLALLNAPGGDLCGRDWDGILAKLDSLRKADPNYHAAEVDGMYYISLRNRGICKIYPQSYEPNASCEELKINLEGGIYDLTQAERFGPLDTSADGLRTWARMYIAGASFWSQDWVQVKDYFYQIMAAVPNLADSSCTTATERWRLASIGFAEQLLAAGDYCGAEKQFQDAFTINSLKNETVYPTATAASDQCNGDSGTPKPKKTKTPAPTKTPKS